MSAKKNVRVPLTYDKIITKKVGKKKKRVNERDKIKDIKKDDSRLSEIDFIQFYTFFHVNLPLLLFWE